MELNILVNLDQIYEIHSLIKTDWHHFKMLNKNGGSKISAAALFVKNNLA